MAKNVVEEITEPKTNGNGRKQTKPKSVSEEQAEAFQRVISTVNTETKVGLFTHRFPDPDAIGSMMGLSWLLRRVYGINSDMIYFGEVAHPQNKVMCGLLEPQLIRVEDVTQDQVNNYGLSILVDTIPSNAGVGDLNVNFGLVIDHHKDMPPQ